MRAFLFVLALVAAPPALAETIMPSEALKHVGQNLTVEGVVSEVHHIRGKSEIFVALGGHYPKTVFRAAILGDDTARFPDVESLEGKTVMVTGKVELYQGRAEIVLHDPGQIKAK